MRTVPIATFMIAAMLTGASGAVADTIVLKSSVRLPANTTVLTLKDVAEIEGEHASQWRDLPVVEISKPNSVHEVSLRDIRSKLDAAGVHWGRVNLSGRSVTIRPSRSAIADPPLAMATASIEIAPQQQLAPSKSDEVIASEVAHESTLRATIAELIRSNLKVHADDLRLSFSREDRELLDLRHDAMRFELHPHSSFASDRIELTVRMWEGSRVHETRHVSVHPLIRVAAASPCRDLSKGETINESDVIEVDQWLPISQRSQIVARIAAIGRTVTTSVKTGELLRERHVRREMIVSRGDLVTVRCLVGGAVISLQAEARADGSEGDQIELRKPGERDTFLATITGRNQAVVDLQKR